MNIALIAHDSKKELMVQFCIAYCGILSRYNICATGTTGKLVSEATGLHIQRFMSGSQGGDPLNAKAHEPNDINILRLCDVHNIPVATNIATAEALIHALERGDLDWREYMR